MTIADARQKCKQMLAFIPQDVFLVAILVLACLASFGLGYLAGRDSAFSSREEDGRQSRIDTSPLFEADERVVASKNGTKYFLPWCAGAERISAENAIWFGTAEAAIARGYSQAANCK